MHVYRSKASTAGRNQARARALWRATGMLIASMRLNVAVIFVTGGPIEAGKTKLSENKLDLVDAMAIATNDSVSNEHASARHCSRRWPSNFIWQHHPKWLCC